MGLGFKDFTAGDVLTAAQVDGYLMRQTIMVFASTSARDTALSGNLEEGMFAFTTDTNSVYYYTGSAWVIYSEPAQSWSPTITQGSSVAGTTNRGWYRRRDGFFEAGLKWTASAAGTGSNVISVSLPVTLPNAEDVGGTFYYDDASTAIVGVVRNDTTTSFKMVIDGATSSLGATSPTIASGDVLRVSISGRYA